MQSDIVCIYSALKYGYICDFNLRTMLSEISNCNNLKTKHLCILQLIHFKDCFRIPAIFCKHTPPLGPMPNDEIDVKNLESLEKYRSYTPYLRQAEEAKKRQAWWKTYRAYVEKSDPAHGEEEFSPSDHIEPL